MLARHAESLFWTGRYLERAEDAARLLDVTYHNQLQAMPWETDRAWTDLVRILGLSASFAQSERKPTASAVSDFLVFEPDNPSAIVASVAIARDNVRSVRELVPTEFWEAINAFYLDLRTRDLRSEIEAAPHALYDHVKRQCQTLAGVAAETMSREEGWQFLQLGWMLERAEMTCRLLDVRYSQMVTAGATGGFHHWTATLKSAAGSEAFRRTYRGAIEPAHVVEFLLLSETFPRSVYFCLRSAEGSLGRLQNRGRPSRPQRLLGRARADLQFLDVPELLTGDLHVYLDRLLAEIHQIAKAVGVQYFRNSEEFSLNAVDADWIS